MTGSSAHDSSERPWFPVPVRVRYAETDAQAVVYHANYLVYMEVARGAYTRALGLPYQEIEARGVHLVVAEAKLRYKASAGYDDALVVLLRIKELRGRLVRFEYRIEHEETGRLLVTGETSHVCVGRDFRPQPMPDWVVEAFGGPVVPAATPAAGG
jgi:acyl-CoA thioester hydrolase